MLAQGTFDGAPVVFVLSRTYGGDNFLTVAELIKLIAEIAAADPNSTEMSQADLWALSPDGTRKLVPRKLVAKLANEVSGDRTLKSLALNWVITTGASPSVDALQRLRQPIAPPPRLLNVTIAKRKISQAPEQFQDAVEVQQRTRLNIPKPRLNSSDETIESIDRTLRKIESILHRKSILFDREDIPSPKLEFVRALKKYGAKFELETSTLTDEYFKGLKIRFHRGAQPDKLREYLEGLGMKPLSDGSRK
jgi:hypothetical protein